MRQLKKKFLPKPYDQSIILYYRSNIYEPNIKSFSEEREDTNAWYGKIQQIIYVISQNTQ